MRKLLLLAGLLAVSGCPSRLRGKPPKSALARPITLPRKVTERNYQRLRLLYAGLPETAKQRRPFRQLILTFLLDKARDAHKRGRSKQIARRFAEAAQLYSPAGVYRGLQPEREMAELAHLTVKRFSPSGEEMQVVPALAVLISAEPANKKKLRGKLDQVLSWLDRTAQLTYGRNFKGARGERVMQRAAKLWPSQYVVETLRKLYVERMITLARATPMERILARRLSRDPFRGLLQTGYKIARLYLRVDRPDEALERLREISVKSSQEENLRRLLEQAVAPTANVEDQIRLAEYVEERDRDVALRVCRDAVKRFPREARAYACVGRLAAKLKIVQLSVRSYEAALSLEPRRRSYAVKLARQYQLRLFRAIADEQLGEAKRLLGAIERFYRRSRAQYGADLKPSLSDVYIAMGQGLYNAGRVADAATAFRKSLRVKPSISAYIHLATIDTKAGRGGEAIKHLDAATKLPSPNADVRTIWLGRIETLRGEALALLGKRAEAAAAWRRAVGVWDLFLQNRLMPRAAAEAHIYRGRALYSLGEVARALSSLDRAIDAAPARKQTYASVISLLVRHGHLPEALDAYHRALGRDEVGEYLKSYCSFWVIGLARRAGKTPDPLALDFLKNLHGDKWYIKLAKPVLDGSFAELAKRTKDRAHLAEVNFYWADYLLARGDLTRARELWKKVIASRMMAFFEYDIAWFNLHSGPAKVLQQPVDRQSSAARAQR